jgi:hypothetical protein
MNGVTVPVILCHADSHKLGLGNNHSDIYHWFKKYGKDMDDVRNDVAKLIDATTIKPAEKKEEAKYFVRKSWKDAKSQVGAYADLEKAKKACDKAGSGYEVYSAKGSLVYPKATSTTQFKVGDKVKIISGAKWSTGTSIQSWVFKSVLYVRKIRSNGIVEVSTTKTGALTGTIKPAYLTLVDAKRPEVATIKPYLVIITASALYVRAGAGTSFKVNTTVKKGQVYTIIAESDGWGKLKSGAGWIDLKHTRKLK